MALLGVHVSMIARYARENAISFQLSAFSARSCRQPKADG